MCFCTIMCTNNEKNDQFYRKVAFLMYSERVNFRPQSWKEASKLKPHRGLEVLSLYIYIIILSSTSPYWLLKEF